MGKADAWGDLLGNRGPNFLPIDGFCWGKAAAKAHRARGLRSPQSVAEMAQ